MFYWLKNLFNNLLPPDPDEVVISEVADHTDLGSELHEIYTNSDKYKEEKRAEELRLKHEEKSRTLRINSVVSQCLDVILKSLGNLKFNNHEAYIKVPLYDVWEGKAMATALEEKLRSITFPKEVKRWEFSLNIAPPYAVTDERSTLYLYDETLEEKKLREEAEDDKAIEEYSKFWNSYIKSLPNKLKLAARAGESAFLISDVPWECRLHHGREYTRGFTILDSYAKRHGLHLLRKCYGTKIYLSWGY